MSIGFVVPNEWRATTAASVSGDPDVIAIAQAFARNAGQETTGTEEAKRRALSNAYGVS
jgi:hypothetical protein